MPACDCSGLGSVEATKTRRSVRTAGMKCQTISIVLAMMVAVAIATPSVMTIRAEVAGVLAKTRRADVIGDDSINQRAAAGVRFSDGNAPQPSGSGIAFPKVDAGFPFSFF